MGCKSSKGIDEVTPIDLDGNPTATGSAEKQSEGTKSAKSPTKAKKKGWSLFSFNKTLPDAEEEKEIRPKP